jgi:hypothetical protein
MQTELLLQQCEISSYKLYQNLPRMQTYQAIPEPPKQKECKAFEIQFFAPCLHAWIPTRENKTSCDEMRVRLKNIKNSRQITTQYLWTRPSDASEAGFMRGEYQELINNPRRYLHLTCFHNLHPPYQQCAS